MKFIFVPVFFKNFVKIPDYYPFDLHQELVIDCNHLDFVDGKTCFVVVAGGGRACLFEIGVLEVEACYLLQPLECVKVPVCCMESKWGLLHLGYMVY